jgi:catechol 2,3-dioxygenase-like lactoylglutathione lyase family enzyme
MTGIETLDHVTIFTDRIEAVGEFYCALLGLRPGPRPPLGVPGAWLYAGERALLHLLERPESTPGTGDRLGPIVFRADGLKAVAGRLARAGVAHEVRRRPDDGTWQLFCRDPAGNRVGLDFDPAEPYP